MASLTLLAFRLTHGDPATWSPAEYDAYLELSVAVAPVAEEADVDAVRTENLLADAVTVFGLDEDQGPEYLDGPEPRQLDLDFEQVVTNALLAANYGPYRYLGHTYPKKG